MMTSEQARARRHDDPATQYICLCLIGAAQMFYGKYGKGASAWDSPEWWLVCYFVKFLPPGWLCLPAPQGETVHDA